MSARNRVRVDGNVRIRRYGSSVGSITDTKLKVDLARMCDAFTMFLAVFIRHLKNLAGHGAAVGVTDQGRVRGATAPAAFT